MTFSADIAQKFGFLDIGWTSDVSPSNYSSAYIEALRRGWFGSMDYLDRTQESRLNVKSYLPWAKGFLVFLDSYAQAESTTQEDRPFQVARYARLQDDYHDLLRPRAERLAIELFPEGSQTKVFIDSAPLPERELGVRAGLGFIGKNGLLIHPKFGSEFFIGVIASDSEPRWEWKLEPGTWTNHCGSCTACLDACPTEAFDVAYRLNPTKCLSYWTIETKDLKIPDDVASRQNPWVFGCDVCQEVCPWNRFSVVTGHRLAEHGRALSRHEMQQLATDEGAYRIYRGKSPLKRLSFPKWLRNISHFLAPEVF